MKQLVGSVLVALFVLAGTAHGESWRTDGQWYDGLVEKAVYDARRTIYGRPRSYELIIFTNKEQHDLKTMTKSDKSTETVEVFKHNHIEVIPTPNYDYKYTTTSHLTVDGLHLTRLDCSSQEFCGTSFKQYQATGKPGESALSYWAFSYMPEAGRKEATIAAADVVAEDSLPLYLRDFPFTAGGEKPIQLLPSQKDNKHTPHEPVAATVRSAGEEDGSYKLELVVDGQVRGTYWFARDRLHVMTKYTGPNGQEFVLKDLSRVDYWTRKE